MSRLVTGREREDAGFNGGLTSGGEEGSLNIPLLSPLAATTRQAKDAVTSKIKSSLHRHRRTPSNSGAPGTAPIVPSASAPAQIVEDRAQGQSAVPVSRLSPREGTGASPPSSNSSSNQAGSNQSAVQTNFSLSDMLAAASQGKLLTPAGLHNNATTGSTKAKTEFDPKDFFDTVARALTSPSEPMYFFFCILLLLFLFVCCQFFGVVLVWGTTLLFLYIIAMHQAQESRAEFFKDFTQFHPRENALQERPQALEELNWLNNMLHQVWVGLAPELCNRHLLPKAHLIIDKALPNALKKLDAKIVLKEINLGSAAPLVTMLNFEKMDPVRPNRMTLNVVAKWVSAEDSYLLLDIGYMMLHFLVRVDSFVANMQLQIVVLADGKEMDQSVISVSVLNSDAVEMPAIKPLGFVPDVLMLPLRKWINRIVGQNINDILGYPQSLSFSIRELNLDQIEEDPITDIQVVYTDTEKKIPSDYILLGKTVTGYAGNVNSGRIGASSVYICYKRSKTEKPITDIAIIFRDAHKQKLGEAAPPDFETVSTTLVSKYPADLNGGSPGRRIYVCVRRGEGKPITRLGVVFADREEVAPPGYYMITHTASGQWKANLNAGDKSARHVFLCYKGGNPPNSFLCTEKAKAPITDLAVLLVDKGEKIPDGFTCIEHSWSGSFSADLNSRHTLTKFNPLNFYKTKAETYLCYKRGGTEKPITDIAIVFADGDKKEQKMQGELAKAIANGWTIVERSASGQFGGNINSRDSSPNARAIFLAFKRGNGPPIADLAIYFKGKEPKPSSYTILHHTLSGAWAADLNSGTGGREIYLCYLSTGRGDASKPAPAPEIGVTPNTPVLPREDPEQDDQWRLSKITSNLPSIPLPTLPNLPSFLRNSDTSLPGTGSTGASPTKPPVAEAVQPPAIVIDDSEKSRLTRFVSGVVNTRQRVAGRIRKVVVGVERQDTRPKLDEVSDRERQLLNQYLLGGDLQKVKDKMKELETDTLSAIPLPSGASGNWVHVAAAAVKTPVAVMNFVLSSGNFDVNQITDDGWSPLHLAAHEGKVEVCGLLLDEGASPSKANKDGLLPLHFFVLHNYSDMMKTLEDVASFYDVFMRLTKDGKLVNQVSATGETPLHFAVRKEFARSNVLLLLSLGANPNLADKKGNTPLLTALLGKKKEVVGCLLEAGADTSVPGSLGSCADLFKSQPEFLVLASKFLKPEVPPETLPKDVLLKEIVDSLCKGDGFALHWLCQTNVSYQEIPPPPSFSSDERTWLHIAAYEGNIGVVRALARLRDTPLNARSKMDGRTPLHEASSGGHWEVIIELVRAGSDPAIKTQPDANLALHFAVSQKLPNNSEFIQVFRMIQALNLLSDHASLVNTPNDKGEYPVHLCLKNGCRPNVVVLAQLGANLNVMDKRGRTPLVNAVVKNKATLVTALLELGAQVDHNCLELSRNSSPQVQLLLKNHPRSS